MVQSAKTWIGNDPKLGGGSVSGLVLPWLQFVPANKEGSFTVEAVNEAMRSEETG